MTCVALPAVKTGCKGRQTLAKEDIGEGVIKLMNDSTVKKYKNFSGIYPHLVVTNGDITESGIGAIVCWNDKLWYITYPAHKPSGSDDKLYCLDKNLNVKIHPASVGGTHANRMIHKESNQLNIGLYFIDDKDNVRVISPQVLQGRLTAAARHLTDPENKLYLATMEEGLYEVNVHTLEVRELLSDKNYSLRGKEMLPGKHGKGAYTGQGRFVYSNNGRGGVLIEWDGKGDPKKPESWTVVDRNKYTEITSVGSIYGAPDDKAPLWSLGWDEKSVIVMICDGGEWIRFRLPKGSYTHDADHGFYTEWPRIRSIGREKLLMTMHGMLFEFPDTFSKGNTAGIRPISRYHKMIVDFTDWNGTLVIAADDASVMGNPYLGRSQSNLWFTKFEDLYELGTPAGWGGVWYNDSVKANQSSEPFLCSGFTSRVLHIKHDSPTPVKFKLEVDKKGIGNWEEYAEITVEASGYKYYILPENLTAEWLRLIADKDAESVTAYFHYSNDIKNYDTGMFRSLASADADQAYTRGILHPKNDDNLTLAFAADYVDSSGNVTGSGYYEVGEDIVIKKPDRTSEIISLENDIRSKYKIQKDYKDDLISVIIRAETASMVVMYENGKRYRLPKAAREISRFENDGYRTIREVVTERYLMNAGGSFYEVPREASGGLAKIKPICTHNRKIYDFASWRGMLVLSGNLADAAEDDHYVISEDKKTGLWFGNVDDLWKLGAPFGQGGPCLNTAMKANEPSDPYLMTGYSKKTVSLSHDSKENIVFTIEIDFMADDTWSVYDKFTVKSGKVFEHVFPKGFNAHWVRVSVDKDCSATAWFTYDK
jgi:hypothetical protein